jgi:hypothetical protein
MTGGEYRRVIGRVNAERKKVMIDMVQDRVVASSNHMWIHWIKSRDGFAEV